TAGALHASWCVQFGEEADEHALSLPRTANYRKSAGNCWGWTVMNPSARRSGLLRCCAVLCRVEHLTFQVYIPVHVGGELRSLLEHYFFPASGGGTRSSRRVCAGALLVGADSSFFVVAKKNEIDTQA